MSSNFDHENLNYSWTRNCLINGIRQEAFGDWENSMLEISFRFTSLGVPRGRAVGIQIGFRSASERQFWLSLKAGRR